MKNITITLTPKEAWVLWHLANSDGFTSSCDTDETPRLHYNGWDISRQEWRNKTRELSDDIWEKVDKKINKEEFYTNIRYFGSLDSI